MTATGDSAFVEPATGSDLAAVLRAAAEQRQSVLIRGAGTKIEWGRQAGPIAVMLSTRRLNRVLAHQHGDLTVTVEGGAALADVNHILSQHRQWLPLDPPFGDRATIGGILATNDSGPLRHRHGTPRDLVIGVELATTEGTIARAGGRVVKNVAGYDLSKLVAGSFGSLAAIVSATFKLSPLPSVTKTLLVETSSFDTLAGVVGAVMASQLEPVAFELHVPDVVGAELGPPSRTGQRRPLRPVLLIRFGSVPAAVDAQIVQARALVPPADCAAEVLGGDQERQIWEQHARRMWGSPGAIVRAGWLPANVAGALNELRRFAESGCIELAGRAAVGTGLIRIDAEIRAQAAVIERLRQSGAFGNVVIVRGRPELKGIVDVWGPQGDRERVFAALKQALDPQGILNAGRGPL